MVSKIRTIVLEVILDIHVDRVSREKREERERESEQ
jgi:hypothetical protein